MAYKGWFLLQKYFVLFCSKSFSYEWTCYSYYLLSDTSWKKGNIQDALFLMVEKFLICSGVFFSFSFPLPEERPPCFLELKVSRQGLSGCAEVRHTCTGCVVCSWGSVMACQGRCTGLKMKLLSFLWTTVFAALVGSSRISHVLVKKDLSLNEHPGPAEVTSHPNVAEKKNVWQKCR